MCTEAACIFTKSGKHQLSVLVTYSPALLLHHDRLDNNARERHRAPPLLEGSDPSSFLNLGSTPICVSLPRLVSLSAF